MAELKYILKMLTKRKIVPVIGNDLSLVKSTNGNPVPLYQYIAKKATLDYSDFYSNHSIHQLTLDPYLDEMPDIHQEIQNIYYDIKEKNSFYTNPLENLASITDFDIYISTSIDDLLEETIQKTRNCKEGELAVINYSLKPESLNAPGEKKQNQQKTATPKITVFKLMGNLKDLSNAAIDEETMLEHLFSLSSRTHKINPRIMEFIEKMSDKIFLFIGCDFPDWLMRFFMRISTNRRLYSKKYPDYVVNNSKNQTQEFKTFLTHCSKKFPNVNAPYNVTDFTGELFEKWREKKDEEKLLNYEGLVFLSYYKLDIDYAETLKNRLEAEGIDVWFDREDLEPGDHEDNICDIIVNDCKIFLTLISKNLLEDPAPYTIRVEWDMAEDVYKVKKHSKEQFDLFPCLVDDTGDQDPGIPEFLRKVKIYNLKTDEAEIIKKIKNKLKPISRE